MDKLRLQNYRCFSDTGDIDIKPITILIGANSSGKSSFLKYFALLKQSIGEQLWGALLWNGSLVDLKDFRNTVKDGKGDMSITMTIGKLPIRTRSLGEIETLDDVRVKMVITSEEGNQQYDFIKEIEVKFHDTTILLALNANRTASVQVNNVSSESISDEITWTYTNSIFPVLNFGVDGDYDAKSPHALGEISMIMSGDARDRLVFTAINSFKNPFDVTHVKNVLKRYTDKTNSAIQVEDFKRFHSLVMYYYCGTLIESLNFYFIQLSRSITYIKPLREFADRYYRYTNHAVNEIAADGSNLPMYYNSLSVEEFQNFNRWIADLFGFTVNLKTSEGHVEILIQEEGKEVRNLVDVGFGYTQILPILTQLWHVANIDSIDIKITGTDGPRVVAIEQPELHLHPRFQGMFVEMICSVVDFCKSNGKDVRIVIETHSETIVNRLGLIIATKGLGMTADDASIVIFNGKKEGLAREVEQSGFSEDGTIDNWPYGFFSDYVY